MPAWWKKRSSRSKDSEREKDNSARASSIENGKKTGKENKDNKAKSFDEVSGIVLLQKQSKNSPRNSRDYAAIGREEIGSSGFSGFDSASYGDIGHPLPMPVESSTDHVQIHGVGSGSGSGFSSIGSSGSTDDQTHVVFDQIAFRRNGDNKSSPVMRSPGRVSRGITTTTSPLHPRFGGINLDSPTGKLEDGKSECHRLPLPPGSPPSPSALPTPRSPGRAENSSIISSKWRKGRLLGRGTFGHVYLGFNCENGQMCAIKEVRVVSDDQSSKECLKQLNQEITLLSQLSHVNIVQYYGSDLSEETLSVYLEYVSGGSIHKLLQEYGAFEEPVIQNYTRQILSGLAYLHGRKTVHRDIKGANILVDPNGEIKLADFGMAKHIKSCSSMLSFKGSPYWMAPEVVMNTNGYSLAVDIWSLGCTILEMATSKPPWSQYEGVAAIFKIGNSKDMPEIPDHLSNDAKSFIRLCLQREPAARPTASQLLGHPFVGNQTTMRAANANITREAFPRAFDGSRTPTALEMQSSRLNYFSFDRDDGSRSPVPRTLVSPRESARTITSLPVSPSSSPLRHYGPAHKSCFISPPSPSYPCVGQTSSNFGDHLVFPVRPITRNTLDPWLEIPQFKSQMPVRSPTRTIL
ncbi:mitogen-activated protein kinase kinase kinase 3-like isoform X1 [Olea europaea var. sylvestris]|uniref:mitogen-activated protein kinase kinase kinase 3-like isoform X1 n=1 Tax=Olea europaea var. sylvestris TaxID=158386 RepID=UPI000C1CF49F|nr:mitogen-activated protein kinase kinase kinase 3-like isoform X1 [Olea europaea var. sylvestris]